MHWTMPVGVVMRKKPGVTRWAKWHWSASAVLPGAGPAEWKQLRCEADVVEYHAATLELELHGAETEAYLHGLDAEKPSVYVVMRKREDDAERGLDAVLITASPYEAQDYTESGEEFVARITMPHALRAWIQEFVDLYHQDQVFVKRRRDKKRVDLKEDGIGDPRIGKAADIYASPTLQRRRLQ